jgi:hypothetical protein
MSVADAIAEIVRMEEHARSVYEARMLALKTHRERLMREWAPGVHPVVVERAARKLAS